MHKWNLQFFSTYPPVHSIHFCQRFVSFNISCSKKFESLSSTNCAHTPRLHKCFQIIALQAILSWAQTKNSHRGTNLDCREGGQGFSRAFRQRQPVITFNKLSNSTDVICETWHWSSIMISVLYTFSVTLKLPGSSKHSVLRHCSIPKLCLQTS